jgi:hypothetical protein
MSSDASLTPHVPHTRPADLSVNVRFITARKVFNFHCTTLLYFQFPSLVVRVHGYTTEMYCASCEVRTEFIYVV